MTKIAGFYDYDHLDCRKMEIFYDMLRGPLKQRGFLRHRFPRVGLYEDFRKEQDHFKLDNQVFRLHESKYFMNPTSESIAYPILYENKQNTYPIKWFDYGPVWRNESKATKKYMRCKQIAFFLEAHAILTNEQQTIAQYRQWIPRLTEFFQRIGFKKVSVVKRPQDDKFRGAVETTAYDCEVNGQMIQIGSLHYLGSNFHDAYNSQKSAKTYGYCWGISERLVGVLQMIYGKDYDILNQKDLLLVYYKDHLSLDEVIKNNKYADQTLGYVRLSDFNSRVFSQQQQKWRPVFTVKIGSIEELKDPDLICRFLLQKKDIKAESMVQVHQEYVKDLYSRY